MADWSSGGIPSESSFICSWRLTGHLLSANGNNHWSITDLQPKLIDGLWSMITYHVDGLWINQNGHL
jgi:hypothetical protein